MVLQFLELTVFLAYLSGVLAADTVAGIQRAGVVACVKHLIANEQETNRRLIAPVEAVSSNIDDKTMHELYLWPFVDVSFFVCLICFFYYNLIMREKADCILMARPSNYGAWANSCLSHSV